MFVVCVPGGEDVPAAVRLTVHLIGGGVAALRKTKRRATAHTGHAAENAGNADVCMHTHSVIYIYMFQILALSFKHLNQKMTLC